MSNLLPQEEKKAILSLYHKRFLTLIFFGAAMLLVISSMLLFPAYIALKSNETLLTQKRDSFKNQESANVEGALGSTIAKINSKLNVFPDVFVSSPIIGGLVDPVLKIKTQAVHITNMTFS